MVRQLISWLKEKQFSGILYRFFSSYQCCDWHKWRSGSGYECGGAVVRTGDIILGDADGVIVVPEDFMPYLEDAEKKEASESEKREQLKNGLVYNRREDFDIIKFFEFGVNQAIAEAKKNECGY